MPGFFDADFRLEKNPDDFAVVVMFVLGLIFSAVADLDVTFAPIFAPCSRELAVLVDLTAGTLFAVLLAVGADFLAMLCSFLTLAKSDVGERSFWVLAGRPFVRSAFGVFVPAAFCFETSAALSKIVCASLLPSSSPLLTSLASTLSSFVFSKRA